MTEPGRFDADEQSLRAAVGGNALWYHTIELRPGVVTPGWFDLRSIVERMPWPDVAGKRCLDVGTYDGFLAFELERRGAREVIAADLSDHTRWDWLPESRASGPDYLAAIAGPDKAAGFKVAKNALGSSVQRVETSIYDLDCNRLGTFDVVVCGSILLHLRDPLRALEAIRRVCHGLLLSAETIDLALSVRHPRAGVARIVGSERLLHWWIPSLAGHRRMVHVAGFAIERSTRPYAIPFGRGHPPLDRSPLERTRRAFTRLVAGNHGIPHAAVLARPRV